MNTKMIKILCDDLNMLSVDVKIDHHFKEFSRSFDVDTKRILEDTVIKLLKDRKQQLSDELKALVNEV